MTFKHWSHYSPISSEGRVLVEQASVAVHLTRLAVKLKLNTRKQKKYYQQDMCKDNFSTCPQPRILLWFRSSSFLKRPVSLKCWLLRPFFWLKASCKSSTVKGLLYKAKAEPSKDYFTHLTLKKHEKGTLSDQPQLSCVISTALLCCWGHSCSKT